jgi:hypothetical protein
MFACLNLSSGDSRKFFNWGCRLAWRNFTPFFPAFVPKQTTNDKLRCIPSKIYYEPGTQRSKPSGDSCGKATVTGDRFTILVLPNLGGISGQLTKTTRGNRTAGQTVRLPHAEEK